MQGPRNRIHELLKPNCLRPYAEAAIDGLVPEHHPRSPAQAHEFAHAAEHGIVKEEATPFGVRYVIEGALNVAIGGRPNLRAIWFIDTGTDMPRLVTAYPLKGTGDD